MRAHSTEKYVTRYQKFPLLAQKDHEESQQGTNPHQAKHIPSKRDREESNHASVRKKTSAPNLKTLNSLSLQSKLSDRVKSESEEYDHFFNSIYDFEEKLNDLKTMLIQRKASKEKRDALRERIREQRRQLAKERDKKRSLITTKTKSDISMFFSPDMHNTKRPSFRLERLGGLVTTEIQFEGKPFEKDPYCRQNNIYYVSEVVKGKDDPESLVMDHVKTSMEFLSVLQFYQPPAKPTINISLPYRKGFQNKKTVIFDLDETLIHCNENLEMEHDIQLPIVFPNGQVVAAGINIRPGIKELFAFLHDKCEVIVFTASHPCYANTVIDFLDPQGKYIHHRLFRNHCFLIPNGPYVKDLRILNRPLWKTVLVDNAAYSYCFQVENGIPILPYYSGENDYELNALQRYLNKVFLVEDVRKLNRETFRLDKYRDYEVEQISEMIEEIYIKKENTLRIQ